MLKIDQLNDREKQILGGYKMSVLKKYLELKKAREAICDEVLDKIESEKLSHEEVMTLLEHKIHYRTKRKDLNIEQKKSKITFNWKKIDKIRPEVSVKFYNYIEQSQLKPEELVAYALEEFLEHYDGHNKNNNGETPST